MLCLSLFWLSNLVRPGLFSLDDRSAARKERRSALSESIVGIQFGEAGLVVTLKLTDFQHKASKST